METRAVLVDELERLWAASKKVKELMAIIATLQKEVA